MVVLLCACASVGSFETVPVFGGERLFVRADGTFRYETWSDDGGEVTCFATGTWRKLGPLTLETTAEAFSPQTAPNCPSIEKVEIWRMRFGSWYRQEFGPFKRIRSSALGPSSNQSLERTRSPAPSSFAGKQPWRAAQLQIR